MEKTIHVLLIEDSLFFVELARTMLAEAKRVQFSLESVDNLADGIARLSQGGFDAVLLDLTLPDSQGLDTFKQLHPSAGNIPTIIYTSVGDEELSLTALNQGAADYLVKSEVTSNWLARSLVYAIQRNRTKQGSETAVAKPAAALDEQQSLTCDQSPDSESTWVATVHDRRLVAVAVIERIQDSLLALVQRDDCSDLQIDFSNVEYISNAALSMLLIVHKRSKQCNSKLTLVQIAPPVYEHFSSRRFDKVFDIQRSAQ